MPREDRVSHETRFDDTSVLRIGPSLESSIRHPVRRIQEDRVGPTIEEKQGADSLRCVTSRERRDVGIGQPREVNHVLVGRGTHPADVERGYRVGLREPRARARDECHAIRSDVTSGFCTSFRNQGRAEGDDKRTPDRHPRAIRIPACEHRRIGERRKNGHDEAREGHPIAAHEGDGSRVRERRHDQCPCERVARPRERAESRDGHEGHDTRRTRVDEPLVERAGLGENGEWDRSSPGERAHAGTREGWHHGCPRSVESGQVPSPPRYQGRNHRQHGRPDDHLGSEQCRKPAHPRSSTRTANKKSRTRREGRGHRSFHAAHGVCGRGHREGDDGEKGEPETPMERLDATDPDAEACPRHAAHDESQHLCTLQHCDCRGMRQGGEHQWPHEGRDSVRARAVSVETPAASSRNVPRIADRYQRVIDCEPPHPHAREHRHPRTEQSPKGP